jgi:hypothetical protein
MPDCVAERGEFEPSGPLIQHEKRPISSTFFPPPGKPIEASKGLRSHPGRASRRALPPSYRLPASLAQPRRQVWNSNCSLEHNLQDHKPPAFFNGVLGCEPAPASINGPDIATSSSFHTDVKHAGNTMAAHPKTLDFSARSEFLVGTPSLRRISRRRYLTPRTKPQISGSDLPAASFRESSIRREVRSVVIVVAGVSFVPRRCAHGYVLVLLRRG